MKRRSHNGKRELETGRVRQRERSKEKDSETKIESETLTEIARAWQGESVRFFL